MDHDSLNWHAAPDSTPYRWEFAEEGREFSVAVPSRGALDELNDQPRLAVSVLGVTLSYDAHVRTELESGQLVRVLEEFVEPSHARRARPPSPPPD